MVAATLDPFRICDAAARDDAAMTAWWEAIFIRVRCIPPEGDTAAENECKADAETPPEG